VERRLAAFVFLLGALLPLDANVAAGQKQTKYVQVVKRAPTSVALGYSTATVGAGQPVQFTARVAPAHPSIPTGSVVFVATGTNPGNTVSSPPIPLDPSGSAVWIGRYPSADAYVVFVSYTGDLNFLSSNSTAIPLTVVSPDFQIVAPDAVTIHRGHSWIASIAIQSLNRFTGDVRLECGNMPAGMRCSFSPSNVGLTSQVVSSPPGTSNAHSTITIRTFSNSSALEGSAVVLIAICGLIRYERVRISAVGSVILFCFLVGCGFGLHFLGPNGTQLGVYPITISGSSDTITHTRVIRVTVVN
jgi:Bacterial Ig-like domain (group 3)